MSRRASARSGPAVVSTAFDHNLSIYSFAAVAAGVSMLAAAQPAEGKVVFTTKTIPILANQQLSIDLNKDGIADFHFNFRSNTGCAGGGSLVLKGPARNTIVGGTMFQNPYASALVRGAKIGPSAHFAGNYAEIENSFVDYCSGSTRHSEIGHWGGNSANRYLGVKFLIHGATHYGWIRLNANFPARLGFPPSATITAYAYETAANKTISAGSSSSAVTTSKENMDPDQSSLGMLALGADGLAIWRREEEVLSHN
jgi:hypothetical protein